MLSLEQIERICSSEREDWQRKVNQGVLKQTLGASVSHLNDSIQALGAMEAVDRLLYALKMEDSRQRNADHEAHLRSIPKRARPIFIPDSIRSAKKK